LASQRNFCRTFASDRLGRDRGNGYEIAIIWLPLWRSSEQMANLLLIGGSRAWSAGLSTALRGYGIEPDASPWVETPAACGIALLEGEWDVAVCFADGASLTPAVAPLLEYAERPPLVVVAEKASPTLTAETLRRGASLCLLPADIDALAESIRSA